MIWMIIISFFIAMLVWLLVGPLILYVDTTRQVYYATLPGIFKAMVLPHEGFVRIRLWIFFIPVNIDPFQFGKRTHGKAAKKPKKKKRFKIPRGSTSLVKRFLHAFRIRKLHLDLDTDDVILNAWLIPAFSMINSEHIRMRANFEGDLSLVLDLRTHLGSLLWILISNRIKSMFNS